MAQLSLIEKETLRRLFGINSGYIFKYWSDRNLYNKNQTRDIILEACSIDIYKDPEYKDLSQQRCVEKIWAEKDAQTVAKLIETLCEFFDFQMVSDTWTPEDGWDYKKVHDIIERLKCSTDVSLPPIEDYPRIEYLAQDIENNIRQNKPELALDRLHTYATQFVRDICVRHSISLTNEHGKNYALDGLVGQIRKYYETQKCFESDFCFSALKASTSLFAEFNSVRNEHSFSHPNPILEKQEAEYVVKIMLSTLMYINCLEEARDSKIIIDDDDELPF